MKKLLFIITLVITITLAGCIPVTTDETDSLSKEEIEALISDMLTDNDSLTEAEIEALFLDLLPDYEDPTNTITTTYDIQSFEASIVDMLAVAKTGVLGVVAQSITGGGTGSGVIYKKEGETTYYLVTNEHVVVHTDDETGIKFVADNLSVVYEKNGLLFEITNEHIEYLGSDATTDLAVLRFNSDEDFSVIPFGDSYDIEIGQFVYTIGSSGKSTDKIISVGVIAFSNPSLLAV